MRQNIKEEKYGCGACPGLEVERGFLHTNYKCSLRVRIGDGALEPSTVTVPCWPTAQAAPGSLFEMQRPGPGIGPTEPEAIYIFFNYVFVFRERGREGEKH